MIYEAQRQLFSVVAAAVAGNIQFIISVNFEQEHAHA